jgi:PilZ domain
MLHTEEAIFQERMKHLRAGARLNSRVIIAVEWNEAGGSHSAAGYTVDISPKGCMAVVSQGFGVGQRVSILNLVNQKSAEAVVIWKGHEGRGGWELGIELQNPPEDYWGIEF